MAPEHSWTLSTFNTHFGGLLPKGAGRYDAAAANEKVAADVRVLQEVWDHPDEPTPFATAPGHHRAELPIAWSLRPQWPGVLTDEERTRVGTLSLVITTRFPILEQRLIQVPAIRTDPRTAALAVQIDAPTGPTWIIGVHLASLLIPYGPGRQLKAVMRGIPKGPAVLAGDHNLWRTACKPIIGNDWRAAVAGGTWPSHRPIHQIDHIWARQLNARGEILPDAGSDHLPVRAVISQPRNR